MLIDLKISVEPVKMDNIIEPNESFDFSKLSLGHPSGIQGGAYFTKLLNNGKPLYIQTTKSLTRQGFVKSGKKHYCDLMFDNNSETIINWIEHLEEKCYSLMFEKREAWFQNSIDQNDIESAFTNMIRVYKSGKYYLLRSYVKNTTNNDPFIKIYNENGVVMKVSDITPETYIVSILEIQGIKFTTKNFQVELELKQMMIIDKEPLFESCLIKTSKSQLLPTSVLASPSPSSPLLDSVIFTKEPDSLETINAINVEDDKEEYKKDDDKEEKEKEKEKEKEEEDNKVKNVNVDDNDNDDDIDNVLASYKNQDPDNEGEDNVNTNVTFEFEDLDSMDQHTIVKDVKPTDSLETITLKKPNEVYYNIYRHARTKAKQAKKSAIVAYLEAKKIKKTYMLEIMNDSDSDFDAEIEETSESELDGF